MTTPGSEGFVCNASGLAPRIFTKSIACFETALDDLNAVREAYDGISRHITQLKLTPIQNGEFGQVRILDAAVPPAEGDYVTP